MQEQINELKAQLNALECSIESNYEKIRIHHERHEYHMAAPYFGIASSLSKLAVQITNRIKFYEAAQRLAELNISANVVSKPLNV